VCDSGRRKRGIGEPSVFFKSIDFSRYSSIKIGPVTEVLMIERGDEIPSDRYLVGGANNLLVSPTPPPLMMLSKDFDYCRIDGELLEVGAATPTGKLLSFAKKNDVAGFEFIVVQNRMAPVRRRTGRMGVGGQQKGLEFGNLPCQLLRNESRPCACSGFVVMRVVDGRIVPVKMHPPHGLLSLFGIKLEGKGLQIDDRHTFLFPHFLCGFRIGQVSPKRLRAAELAALHGCNQNGNRPDFPGLFDIEAEVVAVPILWVASEAFGGKFCFDWI